jgi:hypothetical protein
MTLDSALRRAGLSLIIDSRVKFRKGHPPTKIRVQYVDEPDTLKAITLAPTLSPCPLVMVLASGQVFVLAREGKGGIAVQGREGELPEGQALALDVVQAVVAEHFELQAEEPVKPKRKSKPKASPDALGASESDASAEEVPQEPTDEDRASEALTEPANEEENADG